MIIQKINTQINDSFDLAYRYFSILSVVNNFSYKGKPMDLVKRDCQLLALAVSENKDVSEVKAQFVEKFGSSMATVGNIISKLYKLNILKKEKRIVRINPVLLFDFNSDLALQIVMKHGNKG
jgi:hypothetical protein